MKYKLISLILIMLCLINITYAEIVTISETVGVSNSRTINYYKSATNFGGFKYNVNYGEFSYWSNTIPIAYWQGSALKSSYSYVNIRKTSVAGTIIGHGTYGFTKSDDGNFVYVQLFIDDIDFSTLSGVQNIYVTQYTGASIKYALSSTSSADDPQDDFLQAGDDGSVGYYAMGNPYYLERQFNFSNTIEYYNNETYYYSKYDKSTSNESNVKITQIENGHVLFSEVGNNSNDIIFVNNSLDQYTWFYQIWSTYGTYHEQYIYFIDINKLNPYVITNKTSYDLGEDILIEFGNLEDVTANIGYVPATYEIRIVYYDEILKKYVNKYNEILNYHEYDGNRIIDSSILVPQTNYYVFMVDAEYPEIMILMDTFEIIQSNNDYITTNYNYPPNQIYSEQIIKIFYNANNISKIQIRDNNDILINSYTVSGTGEKSYTIPKDSGKIYNYPYWKIYLNDTVTGLSINQSIKVIWVSEPQITPTIPPTVQKTPIITDSNTTEILTELKNGTKPLIDLVYGIGFIFVDNPDYDDNKMVTIDEMNQWFNSLVKIGIFILLITFYFGFKREDNLRK